MTSAWIGAYQANERPVARQQAADADAQEGRQQDEIGEIRQEPDVGRHPPDQRDLEEQDEEGDQEQPERTHKPPYCISALRPIPATATHPSVQVHFQAWDWSNSWGRTSPSARETWERLLQAPPCDGASKATPGTSAPRCEAASHTTSSSPATRRITSPPGAHAPSSNGSCSASTSGRLFAPPTNAAAQRRRECTAPRSIWTRRAWIDWCTGHGHERSRRRPTDRHADPLGAARRHRQRGCPPQAIVARSSSRPPIGAGRQQPPTWRDLLAQLPAAGRRQASTRWLRRAHGRREILYVIDATAHRRRRRTLHRDWLARPQDQWRLGLREDADPPRRRAASAR